MEFLKILFKKRGASAPESNGCSNKKDRSQGKLSIGSCGKFLFGDSLKRLQKYRRHFLMFYFSFTIMLFGSAYCGWYFLARLFRGENTYDWLCTAENQSGITPCADQKQAIQFLFTICASMNYFLNPVAAYLIDKIGPRKTALIGALSLSSGWLLLAFSSEQLPFYIPGFALIGGATDFLSYPCLSLLRLFPQSKCSITGCLYGSSSFSWWIPALFHFVVSYFKMDLTLVFLVYVGVSVPILSAFVLLLPVVEYDLVDVELKDEFIEREVSGYAEKQVDTASYRGGCHESTYVKDSLDDIIMDLGDTYMSNDLMLLEFVYENGKEVLENGSALLRNKSETSLQDDVSTDYSTFNSSDQEDHIAFPIGNALKSPNIEDGGSVAVPYTAINTEHALHAIEPLKIGKIPFFGSSLNSCNLDTTASSDRDSLRTVKTVNKIWGSIKKKCMEWVCTCKNLWKNPIVPCIFSLEYLILVTFIVWSFIRFSFVLSAMGDILGDDYGALLGYIAPFSMISYVGYGILSDYVSPIVTLYIFNGVNTVLYGLVLICTIYPSATIAYTALLLYPLSGGVPVVLISYVIATFGCIPNYVLLIAIGYFCTGGGIFLQGAMFSAAITLYDGNFFTVLLYANVANGFCFVLIASLKWLKGHTKRQAN